MILLCIERIINILCTKLRFSVAALILLIKCAGTTVFMRLYVSGDVSRQDINMIRLVRNSIFLSILPIVIISFTNFLVIYTIRKRKAKHRNRQLDLQILLISTPVAFVLLRIPLLIGSLLNMMHKMRELLVICDIIVYSCNVLCFSLSNKNFRSALLNIWKISEVSLR